MDPDKSKSKGELYAEIESLKKKLQLAESIKENSVLDISRPGSNELNILLNAAVKLGSTFDLHRIMQEATNQITRLTNIGTSAIYLIDGQKLYLGAMTPPLSDDMPDEFRWASLDDHWHIKRAIEEREIVYIPDALQEKFSPNETVIIKERNLRSIWYVPVFFYDRALGVFIISSQGEVQSISERQIELTRALSNIVAMSLEHSLLNQKLEETNEELSTTLHSIGDAVLSTDIDGKVLLMNPVAEKLCGYTLEEAKGKAITDIFKIYNATSRESLVDPVVKVLKSGKKENLANHTILLSRDGTEYQIEDSAAPIINHDGETTGVVLVFSDVTEDYELREEVQYGRDKLLRAELLGGFGSWEIDLKSNSITGSPGAGKIYGLTNGEFDLETIQKIPLEKYRPELDKALEYLIKHKKPYDIEFEIKRPDGEVRFVHSNAVYNSEKQRIFGIINDITERKKAENALIDSEKRYRDFFMNDLTGDFLSTVEGKVIDCNPAFLTTLGYETLEDVQKLNAVKFYEEPKERDRLLQLLRKDGEVKYFELNLLKSTGEVINVIENVYGVFDEAGNLTHFRGFLFDVTYIKKVEADLIRAKERAEDADRLKTEFLAQMSHEIRSPLNAVLSFTGVLEDMMRGYSSDDMQTCFSGIGSASKRITTTIDSILNMSDLQLGIYQSTKREIEIVHLLDVLVKEYKNMAATKNLELIFVPDVPSKTMLVDDYAFKQIMANLIDNALKYTVEGEVKVKLETTSGVKIRVADTGIGIAKDYLPKIFAPFSQEEQGYTRSYDGNGLGLALVKKYCDLTGSKISVESTKNKGTTFTLEL